MNPFKAYRRARNAYRTRVSWLGEGGQPVTQEQAQRRANICNACPNNQRIIAEQFAKDVASALMGFTSLKNEMNLSVDGEQNLHFCSVCWCSLPTKVWVPFKHIKYTTEFDDLPPHCWIKIEDKE